MRSPKTPSALVFDLVQHEEFIEAEVFPIEKAPEFKEGPQETEGFGQTKIKVDCLLRDTLELTGKDRILWRFLEKIDGVTNHYALSILEFVYLTPWCTPEERHPQVPILYWLALMDGRYKILPPGKIQETQGISWQAPLYIPDEQGQIFRALASYPRLRQDCLSLFRRIVERSHKTLLSRPEIRSTK